MASPDPYNINNFGASLQLRSIVGIVRNSHANQWGIDYSLNTPIRLLGRHVNNNYLSFENLNNTALQPILDDLKADRPRPNLKEDLRPILENTLTVYIILLCVLYARLLDTAKYGTAAKELKEAYENPAVGGGQVGGGKYKDLIENICKDIVKNEDKKYDVVLGLATKLKDLDPTNTNLCAKPTPAHGSMGGSPILHRKHGEQKPQTLADLLFGFFV